VNRPLLFLLFFLLPGILHAQADPLTWLNGARRSFGAQPLERDDLLSRTAALWAGRLAAAGILSHKGDDGSTALDRYRSLGGTEVRVGEILGAGPGIVQVEKGWMASAEHRQLALSPAWTHAGWGSAEYGASQQVTVMMFTVKLVDRLLIARSPEGLTVTGRFLPAGAARGILYNGLEEVGPSEWDPAGRSFRFEVPWRSLEGYLRLGYATGSGQFTLTNSFTWPPGTESPAGPDRFSLPAPSP
jgi:hypothetical protein